MRDEPAGAGREAATEPRLREYAAMLAHVAAAAAARLEEVRLPLHILLENRFGDLNENQEEMLGAARTAAEAVDAELVALRQIAELDLGIRELRRDRILPADLLRSLVPTFQSAGAKRGVTLAVDLEPLVPAIRGDQPQLQDALAMLIGGAVRTAPGSSELRLVLARGDRQVRIELRGGGAGDEMVRRTLASRLIAAMGGTIRQTAENLEIAFPAAG